jgi:hypothetical protein
MNRRCSGLSILALSAVCAAGTAQADDASLGQWTQYALRGITPEFSWADRPSAAAVEPTVLDAMNSRTGLVPKVSLSLTDPDGLLSVSVSRALTGDTPAYEAGGLSAQRLTGAGVGLERTLVAPSLNRNVGDGANISAGVVLAYQHFASWGRGAGTRAFNDDLGQSPASFLGVSYGSGVRVGLEQELGSEFALQTQYQSRIDMSELQDYRGLYSRPGDFDLPAVASAGLAWNDGGPMTVAVGVSRVLYSDIAPFTSAALPVRFLALLGDANSPTFEWRDLTVYSLDWRWNLDGQSTVGLHYTTRQQPEPTSDALRAALAGEFTDDNFGVSLTRRLERFGALRFAASYAPAQYFLGNASISNRDAGGEQVEVEAVWSMAF